MTNPNRPSQRLTWQ